MPPGTSGLASKAVRALLWCHVVSTAPGLTEETRTVRGLGGSLVLLAVSVVACLLVGEWVVATLNPQPTRSVLLGNAPRVFRESDLLPYELLPGAVSEHVTSEFRVPVRINSLGYRGPEFDPIMRGQFRVLVVGDSFTFGHGCAAEETYAAVLGRELSVRCPDREVEVINAGYASCNYPDTYYLYLREIGLDLEPDLVIVGFFVGNDVDEQRLVFHEWAEVDAAGLPLRIVANDARVEDGYWVSRRRARRYRIPVIRDSHLAHAILGALSGVGTPDKGPYYSELIYRDEYAERTRAAAERVRRLFAAMETEAESHGARLVVLMIPAREQVMPESVFGEAGPPEGVDLGKPQRQFAAFFEERGIEYVDLLPDLKAIAEREDPYYAGDQHWTPRGHEIVAGLLAQRLTALGIPCSPADTR
jgi:hypothetical protein